MPETFASAKQIPVKFEFQPAVQDNLSQKTMFYIRGKKNSDPRQKRRVEKKEAKFTSVLDAEAKLFGLNPKSILRVQKRFDEYASHVAEMLEAKGLIPKNRQLSREQALRIWDASSERMRELMKFETMDLLYNAFLSEPPVMDCYCSSVFFSAVLKRVGIDSKIADLGSHEMVKIEATDGPLYIETLGDYKYSGANSGRGYYFYFSENEMRPGDKVYGEIDYVLLPNSYFMYFNTAIALRNSGHIAKAIQAYTKALQLKPDYPPAYVNRAAAYKQAGHMREALNDYNKAINLEPGNPENYFDRALAFRDFGEIDAAIGDFISSINKAHPPYKLNIGAYYELATCYMQKGDKEKARGAYNQYKQLGGKM